MKIIQCEQNSTEWMLARAGVVTASEVDALITPEGAARKGAGVQTYLYQKLAERIMGYTGQTGESWAMGQGSIMEGEAIPFLDFTYGWEISRVGFCKSDDGKVGCSPDGLIGEDGGVEIKCPQPTAHIRYLMEGVLPPQYKAQVMFSLWVTGRKWWTFVSYHRHFPPLIVKVERDEQNMTAIARVVGAFVIDLDEAHLKLKKMMAAGKENLP